MKAVVFHDVGDIRLDDVPEPKLKHPQDALVRITASAICGTDLHFVRGTFPGMKAGTILGHEGVGIVEEVGKEVRNFVPGDRVVIPSTIACGSCVYCRAGYFAQCDEANPKGRDAGTCFYGGPSSTGPIDGLQAEYARIPFANINLVRLPADISDEQALLASDIFPTGFFGADLAHIHHGHTVAVFGCGPVGQFAIASAFYKGAARVFAVDRVESRLEVAKRLGAEAVNFEEENPVATIKELTRGIGVDRSIDAVGVDAEPAEHGPAKKLSKKHAEKFKEEVEEAAPETNPDGANWQPGQAPSQAVRWAIQSTAKAGALSIVGVYPPKFDSFPLGEAMNKNLTLRGGNCNHRKYIPKLLGMMRSNRVSLETILSNTEPLTDAIEAYKVFDRRAPGWMKVELLPEAARKAS